MLHKKILLIFFITAFWLPAFAQTADFPYTKELKKEIDSADIAWLKTRLPQFFSIEVNYSYDIGDKDAKPENTEHSNPSDFKNIEKNKKLVRKEKNELTRAEIYLAIGQEYKRLNRRYLAGCYMDTATLITKKLAAEKPGDSAILMTLSNVRMSAGDYEEVLKYFFELKVVNQNCDVFASCFIPIIYINMGKMDEARAFLDKSLVKWPEGSIGLTYDLMFQTQTFIALAQARKEFLQSQRCAAMPPDSLFDLVKLTNVYTKNRGDVFWEQLYNGGLLLTLFTKTVAITSLLEGDSAFPKTWFILSPQDKELLSRLETGFTNFSKSAKNANLYFAYKSLGTIWFLRNNMDKSRQWYEKAIKEKSPAKSSFASNAAAEYENIATGYLATGDTLGAEKVILRKIKEKPAVDPMAKDYVTLAGFDWWRKDIENAVQHYQTAIGLDSSQAVAYAGIAACRILQDDGVAAMAELKRSLAANPDEVSAYAVWATYSLMQNEPDRAHRLFQGLVKYAYEGDITEIMDRFYVKTENQK